MNLLHSEKGTVMFEMVVACLLLTVFFFMFVEVFFLIQGKVNIVKIAREGAREAAMLTDADKGMIKAVDCAEQLLGKDTPVQINFDVQPSNNIVTCKTSYTHHVCKYLANGGIEYCLSAQAIYPWGR